jgi:hypothetical protein
VVELPGCGPGAGYSASMAQRVHLHIGTMKSATTFLQDLCELHLEQLAAVGVLWPAGAIRYAGIRALFGRAEDPTDPPAAWRTLLHQIRQHPGDVVLSNELLAGLESQRADRLVQALSPAAVHIVITARDPVRVIPSAWQTAIRNGERTFPWAEFSSAVCSDPTQCPPKGVHAKGVHEKFWHQHDVAQLVRRWQPLVGDGNVTVVTVPPAGGDREAVARRFGAAIGVQLSGLTPPISRGNTTLGAHSAELMRRINLAVPGADRALRKYGIRKSLADAALGPRAKQEPPFGLSPDQHAWATQRAHRMVAELQSMGLVVHGDLADLIPTTGPVAGAVDPGAATDSELLAASLDGLIGMARHATKQRVKCDQLRDEVAQLRADRNALRKQLGSDHPSLVWLSSHRMRGLVRRVGAARSRLS